MHEMCKQGNTDRYREHALAGVIMLLMFFFGAATESRAQSGSITLMPYYQSWQLERDGAFSQFTGLVSATLPITNAMTLTLNGRPMSIGGDFSRISGMTDTDVSVTYLFPDPSLALTFGASFPTGIVELSREEFLTSVLFSHSVFGMQAPQFGQGLNLNPGVLYAFAVNENVAAGVGLTYHYKGKFRPVKGIGDYDPGDEILATAGLEMQVDEGETLSFDAIFTSYQKDILEGEEVFHSGNKIVTGVMYSRFFGFNRLIATARYRIKGKSDISVAGELISAQQKMEANNFECSVGYSARMTQDWMVSFSMEARLYEETALPVSGITLFSPGIGSDLRIHESITFPLIFKYHVGTLKDDQGVSGVEAGAGIRYAF